MGPFLLLQLLLLFPCTLLTLLLLLLLEELVRVLFLREVATQDAADDSGEIARTACLATHIAVLCGDGVVQLVEGGAVIGVLAPRLTIPSTKHTQASGCVRVWVCVRVCVCG